MNHASQVEAPSYEADDIIATYTRAAVAGGAKVTIISGDKDLYQVLSPSYIHVRIWQHYARILHWAQRICHLPQHSFPPRLGGFRAGGRIGRALLPYRGALIQSYALTMMLTTLDHLGLCLDD